MPLWGTGGNVHHDVPAYFVFKWACYYLDMENNKLASSSFGAFVSADLIKQTLSTLPTQGKHLLEPLKTFATQNKLPFNILEDHDVSNNEAEIHMHEGDLWHCLEGEVKFIYGGEMLNPWVKIYPDGTKNENEIKAKEIRGGTEVTMQRGDWLWIPAGQPHQHNCSGTARLMIIKIPTR